jgi:hypothetical protein
MSGQRDQNAAHSSFRILRDVFDFAFQEFNVLRSGFTTVLPREREHFFSHVEAVSLAR